MDIVLNLNNIINILDKSKIFLLIKEELIAISSIEVKIQKIICTISQNFSEIKEKMEEKYLMENNFKILMEGFCLSKYKFSEKQIKLFQNYSKAKNLEQKKLKKHILKISEPKVFLKIYNTILNDLNDENIYYELHNLLKMQKNILKSFKKIHNFNKLLLENV